MRHGGVGPRRALLCRPPCGLHTSMPLSAAACTAHQFGCCALLHPRFAGDSELGNPPVVTSTGSRRYRSDVVAFASLRTQANNVRP